MTKQTTLTLMKLAFPVLLLIGKVPIAMTLLAVYLFVSELNSRNRNNK